VAQEFVLVDSSPVGEHGDEIVGEVFAVPGVVAVEE
jgi:hypothetical protein